MKGTFVLLLVIVALDTAPTSQDLHTKYGHSDVERFRVRPDLDMTVQYGSDGCVCQVVLAAPTAITETLVMATYVRSDEMLAMTDEMAPPRSRGNLINSGSFQASCGVGSMSDYQNVLIERGLTACPTTTGQADSSTRIMFKRKECPVVHSATSFSPAKKP
jgi:hypothetical protein